MFKRLRVMVHDSWTKGHIHWVIAIPAPRKYPILFATDIFYLLSISMIYNSILFLLIFSLKKFSNLEAFALWYFRFLKWREIFPGTSLIQIIKWHLFIFYFSANNFKALTGLFTGHNGTKLIIISLVLPYMFHGIELLKWNFEST